ncbi:MAG: formylmethanofuran dehydrogenase, partial [Desulfobulbaceae bacterium]|nr:formylmethanofuran dehydrogenase [Desulfobulbaceae bacterium]
MTTTTIAAKNDWERCVEFHGHSCPGLAIGYRACEAAREK